MTPTSGPPTIEVEAAMPSSATGPTPLGPTAERPRRSAGGAFFAGVVVEDVVIGDPPSPGDPAERLVVDAEGDPFVLTTIARRLSLDSGRRLLLPADVPISGQCHGVLVDAEATGSTERPRSIGATSSRPCGVFGHAEGDTVLWLEVGEVGYEGTVSEGMVVLGPAVSATDDEVVLADGTVLPVAADVQIDCFYSEARSVGDFVEEVGDFSTVAVRSTTGEAAVMECISTD